ncbi:MAG: hypothetical protein J5960_02235, partial [Desulfovibrio sp.]|nr:hypothetical protein [Desulfovibrio sp.]
EQLYLPLEEFTEQNAEIQIAAAACNRNSAKIIDFAAMQRDRDKEEHFARLEKYLDCFRVFS